MCVSQVTSHLKNDIVCPGLGRRRIRTHDCCVAIRCAASVQMHAGSLVFIQDVQMTGSMYFAYLTRSFSHPWCGNLCQVVFARSLDLTLAKNESILYMYCERIMLEQRYFDLVKIFMFKIRTCWEPCCTKYVYIYPVDTIEFFFNFFRLKPINQATSNTDRTLP
jgi:hypothetical protein